MSLSVAKAGKPEEFWTWYHGTRETEMALSSHFHCKVQDQASQLPEQLTPYPATHTTLNPEVSEHIGELWIFSHGILVLKSTQVVELASWGA